MKKKDFLQIKFSSPSCNGDLWHNEDIEMFLSGVVQSPTSQKIQGYIVEILRDRDMRWIHNVFTKGELKKLRVICTAKSDVTREKRKLGFIKHLMKSPYNYLLNKDKLEKFIKLFGMEDLLKNKKH